MHQAIKRSHACNFRATRVPRHDKTQPSCLPNQQLVEESRMRLIAGTPLVRVESASDSSFDSTETQSNPCQRTSGSASRSNLDRLTSDQSQPITIASSPQHVNSKLHHALRNEPESLVSNNTLPVQKHELPLETSNNWFGARLSKRQNLANGSALLEKMRRSKRLSKAGRLMVSEAYRSLKRYRTAVGNPYGSSGLHPEGYHLLNLIEHLEGLITYFWPSKDITVASSTIDDLRRLLYVLECALLKSLDLN